MRRPAYNMASHDRVIVRGIEQCRTCATRPSWPGWKEPCNGYLSGVQTKHKKDSQRERRKRLRERGLL